jgi:hypothetical protein
MVNISGALFHSSIFSNCGVTPSLSEGLLEVDRRARQAHDAQPAAGVEQDLVAGGGDVEVARAAGDQVGEDPLAARAQPPDGVAQLLEGAPGGAQAVELQEDRAHLGVPLVAAQPEDDAGELALVDLATELDPLDALAARQYRRVALGRPARDGGEAGEARVVGPRGDGGVAGGAQVAEADLEPDRAGHLALLVVRVDVEVGAQPDLALQGQAARQAQAGPRARIDVAAPLGDRGADAELEAVVAEGADHDLAVVAALGRDAGDVRGKQVANHGAERQPRAGAHCQADVAGVLAVERPRALAVVRVPGGAERGVARAPGPGRTRRAAAGPGWAPGSRPARSASRRRRRGRAAAGPGE